MRLGITSTIAASCLAASLLQLAHAQQRDRQSRAPRGTAAISGVIVSEEDPRQRVRRAVVSLSGSELPLGRAVIADGEGRFTFANLPAGRFTLKAVKGGYLTTTLGARRPGQPATALVLADGERMTDVTLRLPRGAVITGTVTSPLGEPVPGLQVTALSVHTPEMQQFSSTAVGFVTDDRGMYRIFGLPPGEYYVVASPPRVSGNAAVVRSSEEVDAIFRRLGEMTRGGTAAPGPTRQPSGRPDVVPEKAPVHGYAPVFFPGTAGAADAAIVTVAAGQEHGGVDIVVDRVRMSTIEGTVTNAQGPLPSVMLSITPHGPRLRGVYGGAPTLSQSVGPDGRFTYTGVGPGQYTITARSSAGSPSMRGRVGAGVTSPAPSPSGQLLWAVAEVTVLGEEAAVSLELQPPMRLAGRVRFDGASPPPEKLTAVRVSLTREGSLGMAVLNNTAIGYPMVSPAAARPDGTFEIVGVFPGAYRISASVTGGSGWWLRSAIVDGRDVLDVPLVFGARGVTNATLTFWDVESELFGRLQSVAGPPPYDTSIVVFPADPALWYPRSRRVRTANAASDGRYSIRGLPGGEYLIAVLPDVEPHRLDDRAFLEQLAAASLRITLADGERKQQDLRLQNP